MKHHDLIAALVSSIGIGGALIKEDWIVVVLFFALAIQSLRLWAISIVMKFAEESKDETSDHKL